VVHGSGSLKSAQELGDLAFAPLVIGGRRPDQVTVDSVEPRDQLLRGVQERA
jgi:hypothetical protein